MYNEWSGSTRKNPINDCNKVCAMSYQAPVPYHKFRVKNEAKANVDQYKLCIIQKSGEPIKILFKR